MEDWEKNFWLVVEILIIVVEIWVEDMENVLGEVVEIIEEELGIEL